MSPTSYRNPYTIGGWVNGRRYYGHADLRQYILLGSDNYIWVIGSRRVGKTSLLRQLDQQGRKDYLPLYWDMQGCTSADDLRDELVFALEDREDRLERLGVDLAALADEDAANVLRRVCRQAEKHDVRILLLIDEPESLIAIAQDEAAAIQRLRAAFQRPANLRVVMASTKSLARLHEVTRDWPTSPFLYDFAPLYIDGLEPEDAEALMRQQQRNPVQVNRDAIRRIHHYTGDHPYLLQWLCFHLYRPDHSLRLPRKQDIEVDSMLASLFRLQFQHLSPTERKILMHLTGKIDDAAGIARALGVDLPEMRMYLYVMTGLGYTRAAGEDRLTIGNAFFHRWLSENLDELTVEDTEITDASVQEMAQAGLQEEVIYWQEQLRIYHERLGRLEVAAARHGGEPPARLQETIQEHQQRIKELERKIDAYHLTHGG
jgi:hypothetical protein